MQQLINIIISIVALNLALLVPGFTQTASGSYGNTFVHHDVEMVIHGYHNFQVGSLQAFPGVIGTERQSPRGYIGFTNNSEVSGASNEAHIDGYVRFHGTGTMVLPLGDNGIYAPLETEQKSGVLAASYYNASAAIAVTDKLNGDSYKPLPEHGPFDIENHGPDISFISDYEYWHIEGNADTKITLYYDYNSGLENLANGNPANLSIVGWNGSSWDVIQSSIVSTTLGENLNEGSIATNDYINPSQYSILTFAALGSAEITPGEIGGIAWDDFNGDGIKQDSEPFLPGIRIILEDCDFGNEILVLETDANGQYNFEDLEDGTYRVRINNDELDFNTGITIIPEVKSSTITNDFGRDGATACIEIKFGSEFTDIDLGIVSLSTIGDLVWHDINQDGLYGSTEPGISDIEINLMIGDSLIATTYSGATGEYEFTGVYPGQYHLQVNNQSSFDFTAHNSADDKRNSDIDHSNGAGTSYTFKLSSDEQKLDLDIGLADCNLVSNFVWIDRDDNNIYNEGDTRISNIEVSLYKSTAAGYILYDATLTDIDGQYEFCVAPGTYYLQFEKPYGLYEFVSAHEGDNDAIDSDVDGTFGAGTTPSFDVEPTTGSDGMSAGLNTEDFVGTMVWLDQNRDGVRQIIEPGIAGVELSLYNSNHELHTTASTDKEGRILFTGVDPGAYYMRLAQLGEYEFTTAFAGSDKSTDSNFDESNGRLTSATFEVIEGESNPNIDAGLVDDECFFTPLAYNIRMGSKGIDIIWETESEEHVSHYVIEKQHGNGTYLELNTYKPSRNNHQIYAYTDQDFESGKSYSYRIIAYNLDGEVCISPIKSIFTPEVDVVIETSDENDIVNTNTGDPCELSPQHVYHKIKNGRPQIIWEAEEGSNFELFILERKLRVSDRFVVIDSIYNSHNNQIYAKIDESNLLPGTYFYRLVSINNDGDECISKVVVVKLDEESEPLVKPYEEELTETDPFISNEVVIQDVLLYPNPATDMTHLQIKVNNVSLIEVNIYDTKGQKVLTQVVTGMISDELVTFDIPLHDLREGVYFIRTEINGKMVVRKLVKQAAFSNR